MRDLTQARRRLFPRPVAGLCLLVLLVQGIVLTWLAQSASVGQPREVPVGIVTAPVVGKALADQANALPGEPFDAHVLEDAGAARDGVRDGSVVAALVVDLSGTRDRVLVNRANGTRLNDAMLARIRAIETSRGRSVEVDAVDTSRASAGVVDRLVVAANLLGFAFIVAVSMLWGPVPRTVRRGLLRHAALGAVALFGGVLLAWSPFPGAGSADLRTMVVVALAVWVAGAVTLALESLAGLSGLAIAATLFLLEAGPVLLGADVRLLPEPLRSLLPLLPVGAMRDALAGTLLFASAGLEPRPVLVLVAWLALAWVTVLAARRIRGRFGVDFQDASTESVPGTAGVHDGSAPVMWRVRVAAVVVPVAVALLAVAVLLPGDGVADVAEIPSRASDTECVPTGAVRNLADVNRIAGQLRGSDEFQGGDVGASVELQDGRRLFVFGDTLRSADHQGQRFVRNSMLVLEPGCMQVVEPADRGAIIPDRNARVGYWPMSIGREERPGYDLVAVSAQRVRASGDGEFDFENLGPAVAVFVVPRGGTPQLVERRDIGPDQVDAKRPTWGAAATVHDGWAYLYGTTSPAEDLVFGFSMSVARVRPDDILDRSRWRFWDGRRWVRDESDAEVLIPAQGGVSQTLSVFEQGGTWYALSKRDEFLGTDLTVWTAPSPTGPFTAREPLAQMPSDTVKGELRYMPLAHPGLLPEDGTMVVSYSRNRTDVEEIIDDPLLYRPRFLRVDLPG